MRRILQCGLITVVLLALAPMAQASAEEDRKAFCAAVKEFVRDHPIDADAKGARIERWIAKEFTALAPYARSAIAKDLRMLAVFYRSRAETGSDEQAAAIVEKSTAGITAAKGRVGRYQIALCLPKR